MQYCHCAWACIYLTACTWSFRRRSNDELGFKLEKAQIEQNSLRAKLSMTTSELAKIKATEDELYTLKVCVGGILGRELGLGNGQIKNDQIKVSEASSPVLHYLRLGVSTWNPTSKSPWIEISFRHPVVIKTIQFYSPLSPSHGSALICKYCQLNYKG